MDWIKSVAKAFVAAAGAAVTALLLVLTGDETFADVTTAEWLTVALSVLGTFGVTWAVPNIPVE